MSRKTRKRIDPKVFADKYIANDLNGTRAVQELDPEITPQSAAVKSSRMLKNDNVQAAIEAALHAHGATPEFAVGRLKQIAEQDEEIGAARLASKDILELHGWRKGEAGGMTLNVKNAFFGNSRNKPRDVIDVDPS